MPQPVTDIDVLRDYLRGVVDNADHHAQNVNRIVLALAGGVIWRKDDAPLEVMARQGVMKDVLWFKVRGQRYALSYNHETCDIELGQGSTQGNVLGSFSNSVSNDQVRQIFAGL